MSNGVLLSNVKCLSKCQIRKCSTIFHMVTAHLLSWQENSATIFWWNNKLFAKGFMKFQRKTGPKGRHYFPECKVTFFKLLIFSDQMSETKKYSIYKNNEAQNNNKSSHFFCRISWTFIKSIKGQLHHFFSSKHGKHCSACDESYIMSFFLEDESDKTPDLSAFKLLNSNMWNSLREILNTTCWWQPASSIRWEKEKDLVQSPGSTEISNNRVCPGGNNEKWAVFWNQKSHYYLFKQQK